jgi:hypothetical protein
MSKCVRSDGRVQKALLAAIDDLKLDADTIAKYLSRANLTACKLKAIIYMKTRWFERFPGNNLVVYDEGVMNLLDEFVKIRKKQSPIFRAAEKVDYSVLTENKPENVNKRPSNSPTIRNMWWEREKQKIVTQKMISRWKPVLERLVPVSNPDLLFDDQKLRFVIMFLENMMRSGTFSLAQLGITVACLRSTLEGVIVPVSKSGRK